MPGDIFATKGAEYLLVIVYFLLLIAVVRWIAPAARAKPAPRQAAGTWFSLAEGYHFHPGHTWAAEQGDTVFVGLDDFAAKLIGTPSGVALPRVGDRVRQGDRGFALNADERQVALVSPVEGEVVEVNSRVLERPELATDDPYGDGWLFKVKLNGRRSVLKNLLRGELAAAWMRRTTERLRSLPGTELGIVMPDGGAPVRGFGRSFGPAEWDAVTREFFLMD
jgi:glycine cleavage system H lipoate-binding protein